MKRTITLACAALVSACDDGYPRGKVSPSPDGETYFAVIDDNGGHCGPMKLDGALWQHPIGERAKVQPGKHTIECGGSITFEVPKGVVFEFDYWGP